VFVYILNSHEEDNMEKFTGNSSTKICKYYWHWPVLLEQAVFSANHHCASQSFYSVLGWIKLAEQWLWSK
jgi:hypothetical protein